MRELLAVAVLGAMLNNATLAADTPVLARLANGAPTAGPSGAGASATAAPTSKAGAKGATWRSIAQLPDWSGVWELDWQGPGGLAAARGAGAGPPKLTPEFAAKAAEYQAAQKRGEHQQTDTANCVPPGMPQIMTQPYPVEFLFTPGKVTVAIEAYSQMRRIFTDGRAHLDDPDPTFQGDSIGHWDGDTLVVDTIALIPNSYIAPGIGHSDQMRIEERIRRVSPDKMEIRTTIYDPKALQEPWTVTRSYKRHADWDIKEYICTQNNRDSADEAGRADINLKR